MHACVRDGEKARRCLGTADSLIIDELPLDNLDAVIAAIQDASLVFMAMGSVGVEGNIQRTVVEAARRSAALRQLVRLSVLNASPSSLGINQRAHSTIEFAAALTGIPYTTIRPAIFSASLLAGAQEVRDHHTWTGLADTGQVALIDHLDVADVAADLTGQAPRTIEAYLHANRHAFLP